MAEPPGTTCESLVSGATPRRARMDHLADTVFNRPENRWPHLADAEIVGAWRFRTVLATDGIATAGRRSEHVGVSV